MAFLFISAAVIVYKGIKGDYAKARTEESVVPAKINTKYLKK